MRSHYFDQACRDFLGRHPEGQVLNLGCGLDSRIYRVDPPAELPWFDLDYPEVMDLRERLYLPRAGALSGAAPLGGRRRLAARVPRERPALVLAEGLMPYLRESQVRRLVERLVDHLGSGELLFDGYGRLGIMLLRLYPPLRETGAQVPGASTTRANSSGGIRPCASSRRSPTTTRRTLPSCRSRRG